MIDDELKLSKRFVELANNCYNRNIPFYTDFLTLNEQNILSKTSNMPPIYVCTIGGYNLAERKIAAFYPYEGYEDSNLPFSILKITPVSIKFSEELTHRDYLGAIINLGIDRSVIGDIIVANKHAYVFCLNKIKPYIKDNLTRIRHTQIMIEDTDYIENDCIKYQEINGFVASLRIDTLLSLTTKLSRSKAISLIEDAKVFINGKLITTNSYNLKENDIISVRGYGKFRFVSANGTSKKGRLHVTVYQYT